MHRHASSVSSGLLLDTPLRLHHRDLSLVKHRLGYRLSRGIYLGVLIAALVVFFSDGSGGAEGQARHSGGGGGGGGRGGAMLVSGFDLTSLTWGDALAFVLRVLLMYVCARVRVCACVPVCVGGGGLRGGLFTRCSQPQLSSSPAFPT